MRSENSIRLTQTVQKGGCAAKVEASELRKILSRVQFPKGDENLLVDGRYFDDAAIYKVTDDLALVQTLDFFTPIVDSAKLFGKVAAANALSDVYAMGGKPKTAMGILAFPLATMDADVIVDVMQGAADVVSESGAFFVGGHSIDDDSLKFGLSVTGYVDPKKVWSNRGAKVGDVLILTKALGTGAMTAALKRNAATESDIMEAIDSMCNLNNVIDFLAAEDIAEIHAATDITGFGLSGHCMQLAKASEVSLEINTSKLPVFAKAIEFAQAGFLTKAHRTNANYTEAAIVFAGQSEIEKLLCFDPQTSGGLLLCVSAKQVQIILSKIQMKFPKAAIVGEVKAKQDKEIYFAK